MDKDYCKDCTRSIYHGTPTCDVNIENDGKYVLTGECYCKVMSNPNIPSPMDLFIERMRNKPQVPDWVKSPEPPKEGE